MHIFIKNKNLVINNYNVKCAIGKRGIQVKKKEGDNITPKGKFKIKYLFYRKDRISKIKTGITKLPIQKNMGWCDDPCSSMYNKLIKLPYKYSAEKLYRIDNTYDIILVLNYNLNPTIKSKGSAIFIHVAKKNYKNTAGCVAINKKDFKKVLENINKKTWVIIG